MALLTDLFGLHWGWMALGVALAIAELLAPGYFLIWLAAAALVTGLVAAAMPVGLEAEIILFAVLCALALVTRALRLRSSASSNSGTGCKLKVRSFMPVFSLQAAQASTGRNGWPQLWWRT
jgi:membrane protein implicated in regulation of membrane protease activity